MGRTEGKNKRVAEKYLGIGRSGGAERTENELNGLVFSSWNDSL